MAQDQRKMDERKSKDLAKDDQVFGKEGTFKHWFYYGVPSAVFTALLFWLGSLVSGWYSKSEQATLTETIANAVDNLIPKVTEILSKNIAQKFGNLERDKIEPLRKEVHETSLALARLQGDVKNLENGIPVGKLRAEARQLGIKDPQIFPAALKPKSGFKAIYEDPNDLSIEVTFEIEEIKSSSFILAVTVKGLGPRASQRAAVSRRELPLSKGGVTIVNFDFGLNMADSTVYQYPPIALAVFRRVDDPTLVFATGFAAKPSAKTS
jgi:hypothetical protein